MDFLPQAYFSPIFAFACLLARFSPHEWRPCYDSATLLLFAERPTARLATSNQFQYPQFLHLCSSSDSTGLAPESLVSHRFTPRVCDWSFRPPLHRILRSQRSISLAALMGSQKTCCAAHFQQVRQDRSLVPLQVESVGLPPGTGAVVSAGSQKKSCLARWFTRRAGGTRSYFAFSSEADAS